MDHAADASLCCHYGLCALYHSIAKGALLAYPTVILIAALSPYYTSYITTIVKDTPYSFAVFTLSC